jgi:hypothetical protein
LIVITGLVVPTATLPNTPAEGVITSVYVGASKLAAATRPRASPVATLRQTADASARKIKQLRAESEIGKSDFLRIFLTSSSNPESKAWWKRTEATAEEAVVAENT